MVGDSQTAKIVAFLSNLLDEPVSPDTPVRLRSVQRAAFSAWTRKEGLQVRTALLSRTTPFSVTELLANPDIDPVSVPSIKSPPSPSIGLESPAGVGIDIEDVASIPHADDYREHDFFRDNFTQAEIAYCLAQPDVRASFCGTWAAKEALLKAGLNIDQSNQLNTIEITRDRLSRPLYAGWHLSISHTPTTAIAFCMPQTAPKQEAPAPAATQATVTQAPVTQATVTKRRTIMPTLVVAAIVTGALIFAFKLAPMVL
jgi:phosphopantetheine--protein transferase-like protein